MQASSAEGTPVGQAAAPEDVRDAAAPDAARELARDFYATMFTLQQRVMRDLVARLSERGLSPTQFKFLHRLLQQRDGEAELSVKALGEHHCLSLAATSRAVDGLHRLGYVERDECPTDRRVKRVRITPAGRELLREAHAVNVDLLADFTATLSDRERHDLATAIAPLMAKLDVRTSMEGPSR